MPGRKHNFNSKIPENIGLIFLGKWPCREKIILSSEGGAASFFQGGVLGQYEYDSQKHHYFLSKSETHHEDHDQNIFKEMKRMRIGW